MISMGIDASTTCVGYSIWNEDTLITYGKLVPNSTNKDWTERIQNLAFQIQDIINKYNIEMIIEENVPLINRQK